MIFDGELKAAGSVPLVLRGIGIWLADGVRVADLTAGAVDADLAAARVACVLGGGLLRLGLCRMNRGRALRSSPLGLPPLSMLGHVVISHF